MFTGIFTKMILEMLALLGLIVAGGIVLICLIFVGYIVCWFIKAAIKALKGKKEK